MVAGGVDPDFEVMEDGVLCPVVTTIVILLPDVDVVGKRNN